jgi:hypothetical protein
MWSVGLDVSGKRLGVSAVNERKRRVFEGEGPASRAGVRALMRQVGPGPTRVAVEAGHQVKWVAETVKQLEGVQVPVGPPNEVKWITESRGQTDRVEAKPRAERARAGLRPRAVPVVEGPVRELREVVSARQQLQRKRVALLKTIRGDVSQDGHRLPEQFVAGAAWREQRARLPVSAPRRLLRETFMTSLEALGAAEQRLTARRLAIEDPRGALLERPRPSGRWPPGSWSARWTRRGALTTRRRWRTMAPSPPPSLSAGRSGSSGGSIARAGQRAGGSCSNVPIRWCA